MPKSKGDPKSGGRKKGTPNKSTKEIKDAFQMFVENNVGNFEKWIIEIAETNPAKAMELVSNVSEYILPKLSRAEVKNEVIVETKVDLSKYSLDDLKDSIESNKD